MHASTWLQLKIALCLFQSQGFNLRQQSLMTASKFLGSKVFCNGNPLALQSSTGSSPSNPSSPWSVGCATMLQKPLRDDDPVLLHNPSDESLFDDLNHVAKATPGMVSKSIAYRGKDDRSEIARILGHLPMVKQSRALRFRPNSCTPQSQPQSARGERPRERPQSRAEGRLTPRAASYMRPPSAGCGTRPTAKTPTPPAASSALQTHRLVTPRAPTPRVPVRSAWDGPQEERQERQTHRSPTPATPAPAPTLPGNPPQSPVHAVHALHAEPETPKAVRETERSSPGNASPQAHLPASAASAEALYQQASQTAISGTRLGFSVLPQEDEVPAVSEKELEQVQKRYLHKLAEVGVDPKGKTAGQILQTLYARGSRTESQRMNAEAQKKVLVRLRTPLCIKTVLKERALQEVKAARDKPADLVDECLDRWEIETLAEVCRSMKHFDEAAAGNVSTYTRSYGGRQYLGRYDRKKYIRPPTP